jgi:UDP-glucose:(heptosyl)LPS alpha-1,3-glucosyltransferase
MKIAVVVKDFDPQWGGVERFAHHFVDQAARRGHELHVFANRWGKRRESYFVPHPVPALRHPPLAKLISFPLSAQRVVRQEGPFDVVFALTPLLGCDVYRLGEGLYREALQRKYRNPLVRSWKRWGPKGSYLLWMEKRVLTGGRARKVIAISESSRREVLKHYSLPEGRVITIYNGVDLQRFNPGVRAALRGQMRKRWGIEANEMAVLFVGNDFRRKGLRVLCQAMSYLIGQGARIKLMVAGRDSPEPYLWACRKMGIERRVVFMGAVDRIEAAYAAADLLCLPTHYDPFGYSCLEAMACGLAVVTTTNAGAAEIIEEGKNGSVVPAGDPLLLAEAIASSWREGRWREVNRDAWRTANAFTLERNAEAILSLFSSLEEAGNR